MPVSNRRQSREAALQSLYQMEHGDCSMSDAIDSMRERGTLAGSTLQFACDLVEGVFDNVEELDAVLGPKLHDWTMPRLATIDRTILRIGAFELYHRPEVPPAVTLSEAVVLAKKYGTAESGRFVNGVLGAVLAESPKAEWNRDTAPPEEQWEQRAENEEPTIEEEVIDSDSPEADELKKKGLWTLRSEV